VRVMRRTLDVLFRERVQPEKFVTTPFRVSVLVPRAKAEALTRALHTEFVLERGAPVSAEEG